MAQRSNRRFLNLVSVEVFETVGLIGKEAGGFHHGQELLTPRKAEYIGADHKRQLRFRLQSRGRPYIGGLVIDGPRRVESELWAAGTFVALVWGWPPRADFQ
jgi:hypothetical protein